MAAMREASDWEAGDMRRGMASVVGLCPVLFGREVYSMRVDS